MMNLSSTTAQYAELLISDGDKNGYNENKGAPKSGCTEEARWRGLTKSMVIWYDVVIAVYSDSRRKQYVI